MEFPVLLWPLQRN